MRPQLLEIISIHLYIITNSECMDVYIYSRFVEIFRLVMAFFALFHSMLNWIWSELLEWISFSLTLRSIPYTNLRANGLRGVVNTRHIHTRVQNVNVTQSVTRVLFSSQHRTENACVCVWTFECVEYFQNKLKHTTDIVGASLIVTFCKTRIHFQWNTFIRIFLLEFLKTILLFWWILPTCL